MPRASSLLKVYVPAANAMVSLFCTPANAPEMSVSLVCGVIEMHRPLPVQKDLLADPPDEELHAKEFETPDQKSRNRGQTEGFSPGIV